jgi:glycosyltransferase involved in cell wall biosynthesis
MIKRKKKILLLSDDLRMHSGIATVSKQIVLNTVKEYDWVQLGASLQHPDQGKVFDASAEVAAQTGVEDAYVRIYANSGYGNPDILRELIQREQPDAILHFTDPRFWGWLYAMEHELRQMIPLMYYTIWDSTPYPKFNTPYYESCDLLMCISKQTHNIVKQCLKDKNYQDWQITYVPHGINESSFFPITEDHSDWAEYQQFKSETLPAGAEYVVFFNARNIRRKHISDLIIAYKKFNDMLDPNEAAKNLLLLHTDPIDDNGTDLFAVINEVCPMYKVAFTGTRLLSTKQLNYLYNMSSVTANIASNEGFGLGTAESVMAGTPIVVNVTGGLQDQCGFKKEDGSYITEYDFSDEFQTNADRVYEDHGEWVKPVFPAVRSLQGSPATPYIYDDIADINETANALLYWNQMSETQRKQAGALGREYFKSKASGLSAINMGDRFIGSMNTMFDKWTPRKRVEMIKI